MNMQILLAVLKQKLTGITIISVLFVAIFLVLPNKVNAYSVSGTSEILVGQNYFSDNIDMSDQRTEIFLSESYTSSSGSNAQATAAGNLATGTFHVNNQILYNPPDFSYPNSGSSIKFIDKLHFDIPAGYYEKGAYVEIPGNISGSLWISGGQINAGFHAGLLSPFDISEYWNIPQTGSTTIDLNFILTETLVQPGTTLLSPLWSEFDVTAELFTYTSAHSVNGATADCFNTIQLYSVNVPDYVTWYSESGVFLGQVVPIPPTIWILSSGLTGLIYFKKRKKK